MASRGAAPWRAPGARLMVAGAAALPCLLAACALPLSGTVVGPTLPVQPGPGRSLAMLDADRRACMAQTDAQLQPIASRPGSSAARIQVLYNNAYGRCMAARGNVVAAAPGPAMVAAVAAAPSAGGTGPGGGRVTYSGLRDPESAAARQALGATVEQARQACEGERIDVAVTEAVLAPAVPARTVVLSTPDGGMCFGEPGQNAYLLAKSGTAWRVLLGAEPGSIIVSGTRHGGYPDLELHSLGLCTYGYQWRGSRYVQASARGCATAAPPSLGTLGRAIRGR